MPQAAHWRVSSVSDRKSAADSRKRYSAPAKRWRSGAAGRWTGSAWAERDSVLRNAALSSRRNQRVKTGKAHGSAQAANGRKCLAATTCSALHDQSDINDLPGCAATAGWPSERAEALLPLLDGDAEHATEGWR